MIKNRLSLDYLIIFVFIYEFLLVPAYLYLYSNGLINGLLNNTYTFINIIIIIIIATLYYKLIVIDLLLLLLLIYMSAIYILNDVFVIDFLSHYNTCIQSYLFAKFLNVFFAILGV